MVGPKGAPKLDAANQHQEQQRHDEGGFDCYRALLRSTPRWSALAHCTRISVLLVSDVGKPGQVISGVKA